MSYEYTYIYIYIHIHIYVYVYLFIFVFIDVFIWIWSNEALKQNMWAHQCVCKMPYRQKKTRWSWIRWGHKPHRVGHHQFWNGHKMTCSFLTKHNCLWAYPLTDPRRWILFPKAWKNIQTAACRKNCQQVEVRKVRRWGAVGKAGTAGCGITHQWALLTLLLPKRWFLDVLDVFGKVWYEFAGVINCFNSLQFQTKNTTPTFLQF